VSSHGNDCDITGRGVVPCQDMLKRQRAKAGIEKRVHPHGLRHSCASELADEGWPVNLIQAQLGHESLATTSVYLAHIAPAALIAAGRRRTWKAEGA
jgi:integrase